MTRKREFTVCYCLFSILKSKQYCGTVLLFVLVMLGFFAQTGTSIESPCTLLDLLSPNINVKVLLARLQRFLMVQVQRIW